MRTCSWAQYAILRTDLAIFRLSEFRHRHSLRTTDTQSIVGEEDQ